MLATQEAVDLRRKLANARPDAYLPGLARSLAVRGTIERAEQDFERAAATFAEGLRLVLPLFSRNPRAYERLVNSLTKDLAQSCSSGGIAIPEDLAAHVRDGG